MFRFAPVLRELCGWTLSNKKMKGRKQISFALPFKGNTQKLEQILRFEDFFLWFFSNFQTLVLNAPVAMPKPWKEEKEALE
jgi:hypothetical protein